MPGVYFIMLQAAEAHAGLFQATRPVHRASGACASRPERQAAMTVSPPAQDTGHAGARAGEGALGPKERNGVRHGRPLCRIVGDIFDAADRCVLMPARVSGLDFMTSELSARVDG